ncbi:synaptogenesis protein syg-2-like isoform X2 [Varroa destructor]|uniref:Ig-like domain-containing protein n=1 Tax=Varroa destructor TaxID=109461 RepID=A0A7M7MJX1_VARDE|nr:synaptogenesis protein syg-2-like isoform X2 [Varroa destructor]
MATVQHRSRPVYETPKGKTDASQLTDDPSGRATAVYALNGEQTTIPFYLHRLPGTVVRVKLYQQKANRMFYEIDGSRRADGIFSVGSHKIEKDWASRSYLSTSREPALLKVGHVTLLDSDTYICNVQYAGSEETFNETVRLIVMIRAAAPLAYVSSSEQQMVPLIDHRLGPFNESTKVTLVCEVLGGVPRHRVYWVTKLTQKTETVLQDITRVHLPLVITRNLLLHKFVCVSEAIDGYVENTTVIVDINIPVEDVTIVTNPRNISGVVENKEAEFHCRAEGSRPPTRAVWSIEGGPPLEPFFYEEIGHNLSSTFSVLMLAGKKVLDGRRLRCSVTHPVFGTIVREYPLNVLYSPRTHLRLGKGVRNPHDIPEGSDVYFECVVDSKPKPSMIFWYHNGRPIETKDIPTTTAGTYLILQSVNATHSGNYACLATNPVGSTASENVSITIKYAPRCMGLWHQGWNGYSATNVTVLCTLDSNPRNMNFNWFVQIGLKKADKIRLPFTVVNETTTKAVVDLSTFEQPSVTVECEGKNDIGVQRLPCVLQLSKRYDLYDGELRDCTVSSHDEVMYFDRLVVQCRLPRTPQAPNLYVMEVYTGDDMSLLLNVSSGSPQFIIASRSFGSADQLVLLIYSVNADTNVRSQRTVRLAIQTNPYTAPLASIESSAPGLSTHDLILVMCLSAMLATALK